MKTISKNDFRFTPAGFGIYNVTYTSPATGKSWTTSISYMPIIDATKNSDMPKKSNLNELKKLCKI